MTEVEWLAKDTADFLVDAVIDRVSERKRNLLACAVARRIQGFLESEPDRIAIEMTERMADGLEHPEEEDFPTRDNWDIRWYRRDGYSAIRRVLAACWESICQVRFPPGTTFEAAAAFRIKQQYDAALLPLLRDVFGNPFRTLTIPAAWLQWEDGVVPRLAQAAYDERLPNGFLDPERLAVLADALTDAGCADEAMLSHLRSADLHARGCWVIDRLLNKK